MDKTDRELWEIDENLMRANLSEVDRSVHLKRRKELWEKRTAKPEQVVPVSGGRGNKGFAQDTAGKTGITKQHVNRSVSRANVS